MMYQIPIITKILNLHLLVLVTAVTLKHGYFIQATTIKFHWLFDQYRDWAVLQCS